MKLLLFIAVAFAAVSAYPHRDIQTEPYEEKYIPQFIDHFDFLGSAGPNGEYQQRYLISDKYWAKGSGPILFYTGNEGDVVNFWNNTGFVFALAKKFSGLILFGEHRYYGKSLPFGDKSFQGYNIGFLTIDQALADFAYLVKYVKKENDAQNCTVFAFGGSYGGMLTAYMRYKYPHIIAGGVASSAPFVTIAGNRPRSEFFEAVTNTFHKADSTCPESVRAGFTELVNLFNQEKGKETIQAIFNLCPEQMSKPNVAQNVLLWARNAFTLLAMVDYPYPADFMAKLPGHPVNVACSYITGKDKLSGLANITALLYGTEQKCHDTFTEYVYCSDPTGCGTGPDAPPWDYQACTELLLPGGSNNKTDMFPALEFTLEQRAHYCQRKFNLGIPRPEWLGTHFFGTLEEISKASRLIFPNGDLDPWMPGGVLEDLSEDLIAIIIEGGAHHLDLREANPADPPSVIQAREKIAATLQHWMENPEK